MLAMMSFIVVVHWWQPTI